MNAIVLKMYNRTILKSSTGLKCCGLLMLAVYAVSAQPAYTNWETPVNLGTVNSPGVDQHPAISKNGLSLYFVSDRPGGIGGWDIYVSQRPSLDAPWGPATNLGSTFNSPATENAPDLSRDGHLLFFGSNRPGGCGGSDIWVSYRRDTHDDFAWETPINLGCSINTQFDEDGPTYFVDDDTGLTSLYFTSLNRPNNIGDWDIYVSTVQPDGTFGAGRIVPELNSPARDTRTSISRNGLEMYITSSRGGGLGGLDVWIATRASINAPWSQPVNLGAPVNSSANEGGPALSFDGTTLYFYSTRAGGSGSNDLYVTSRTKLRGDHSH